MPGDDIIPNAVEEANAINEKINNDVSRDYSQAKNSSISTEEETKKKEEKARALIESVIIERLKPIEAQIEQLPQVIHQIVVDVISQIQTQQAPAPQQAPAELQQKPQINIPPGLFESLAPLIQKFLGSDPAPTSGNQAIMDMIVDSYMKKMKMDIDSQFMATYNQPVTPPNWQELNANPRPSVKVE